MDAQEKRVFCSSSCVLKCSMFFGHVHSIGNKCVCFGYLHMSLECPVFFGHVNLMVEFQWLFVLTSLSRCSLFPLSLFLVLFSLLSLSLVCLVPHVCCLLSNIVLILASSSIFFSPGFLVFFSSLPHLSSSLQTCPVLSSFTLFVCLFQSPCVSSSRQCVLSPQAKMTGHTGRDKKLHRP